MEYIVDVSENKQVMIFRQDKIIRCHECDYYGYDELEHFTYCDCWCSFDIDPFGYCSKAERRDCE